MAEQVAGTREGKRHGTELPQDLVPLLHGCVFLSERDTRKDLCQPLNPMGGRWIVMATVSMTQPRTSLIVLQEQSPFISFLTEIGWLRKALSDDSNGRSTSSIARMRTQETRRGVELVCARPTKSSTNTST